MALLYGRAGRLNTKNTGFRPGQVTFTAAKAAAKLRLVADRDAIDATREDLSYVVAEV